MLNHSVCMIKIFQKLLAVRIWASTKPRNDHYDPLLPNHTQLCNVRITFFKRLFVYIFWLVYVIAIKLGIGDHHKICWLHTYTMTSYLMTWHPNDIFLTSFYPLPDYHIFNSNILDIFLMPILSIPIVQDLSWIFCFFYKVFLL